MSRPSILPLRRLLLLEAEEGPAVAWSTAYFFFLLMSFYLLRPVREAMGISRGADKLPWLMTGTLAAMLLINPAYAALASRLPRRRFVPLSHHFFALNLLVLYVLFRLLPGRGAVLRYGFYIWLSVFNLFVVSLFWAFLSDVYRQEQGQRLFGFISMGGTAGALCGAALTDALSRGVTVAGGPVLRLAPASLLLVSLLCLELAVVCMRQVARQAGPSVQAGSAREPGPGALGGLRLLGGSRALQLISGYILLYSATSTLLYLRQGQIVEHAFASDAARTAAFARIDFWVNALTLLTQALLASRLLTGLGLTGVLCLLPSLTLLGFGALWRWPVYPVLALVMVLRRGLHYAVDRPAREVLYVPLPPDAKYKAKPLIDTFVYRLGDLLGVWLPSVLAAIALPLGPAALVTSGLWLGVGFSLGRQVEAPERAPAPVPAGPAGS